jgi:hypothetical protein
VAVTILFGERITKEGVPLIVDDPANVVFRMEFTATARSLVGGHNIITMIIAVVGRVDAS